MKPSRLAGCVAHPIWLLSTFCLCLQIGCTSPLLLISSSDSDEELVELDALVQDDVQLLKDVCMPWGMNYLKLEGIALVTGLDKTGSDPPPAAQRNSLLADMQTHDVKNPNMVLSSLETALVIVRGYLPPGIQKGDPFDVEVRVPSRSDTVSLRGGWLMRARMRQTVIADSVLHTGDVEALAEGAVVVDAVFHAGDDDVKEVRGRVLGSGVSLISRRMGMAVRSENHSVRTASLVGSAINARFHTYDRGVKRGVASPKRDNFVELDIHPRYKHNLGRYIRVIQNIALGESPVKRVRRIERLERMLLEPVTSSAAALRLEAIGKEAISVLSKGLQSPDLEVRFYAAEALAYLDEPAAAEPLVEAARNEPAFRWHAIAALSAMDHVSAYEGLTELLDVSSAETRYAAFRAMRERSPLDPLVAGAHWGDEFTYHRINSSGPPMIHVSRSRTAEIVAFGEDLRLRSPAFLYAGKNIMLKGIEGDQIKVMRFDANQEDKQQVCSSDLDDIVRTVVHLGGTYADVIQCIHEAKDRQYLDARVVIDALPRLGRTYRRDDENEDEGENGLNSPPAVDGPLPEMFQNRLGDDDDEAEFEDRSDIDAPAHLQPKGFFGKIKDSVYKSEP